MTYVTDAYTSLERKLEEVSFRGIISLSDTLHARIGGANTDHDRDLKDLFERNARLQLRLKGRMDAWKHLRAEKMPARLGSLDGLWDDIRALYQQMEERVLGADLERESEPYRIYLESVGVIPCSAGQSVDEDLSVVGAVLSVDCPITGKLMEDPVKSKRCGHSYSKNGILGVIQQNGGREVKCPHRGCKHKVGRADLEQDKAMSLRVSREVARQRAERASQMSQVASQAIDI